jgi:SAM-dependent methyltransferase
VGWWGTHVVPRLVDHALAIERVRELRDRACAGLSGRVLEIGFGSGRNLPHYPAAVTGVGAVEPSDVAWRLAADRVAAAPMPVRRIGLVGDRVAAPDACYDAALVTFTLCTIPDPVVALAEVRRVLRPGGPLVFLEHGLSPDEAVARWQRRLTPLQRRVVAGCRLDRPTDVVLRLGGFEAERLEHRYLPGPSWPVARVATYLYLGVARPVEPA